MTQAKKPREWWIHSTGNAYTRDVSSNFPVVHVVEHAAFEKAVAALKEIAAKPCTYFEGGCHGDWASELAKDCLRELGEL